MTRHYLDHASTSPLRQEAATAMATTLTGVVGDPGCIHHEGMVARHAVETAREQVAAMLGARSREVVFTSGATESIAMACWGSDRRDGRHHSVLSAVEHPAVRHQAARGPFTVVGVSQTGLVDPDEVLEPSPVLEAMEVDAQRSLRLSVGWNTTDADYDAALDAVPGILGDLR